MRHAGLPLTAVGGPVRRGDRRVREGTLWGRMEFRLYVAARPDKRRRVAVVGAGGTTVLDDLAEIEEFDRAPWSSDQVSGLIAFEALRQSAGRRAVLRDRDAFPVFLDTVRSIEPAVARTLERIAKEVDVDVAGRLNEAGSWTRSSRA